MATVVHADEEANSSFKLHQSLKFFLIVNFFGFVAETHIALGRNIFINTGKQSFGFGSRAVDLETITSPGIFRPSNRTGPPAPRE